MRGKEVTLQEILLSNLLPLFEVFLSLRADAVQIKLLHDRRNTPCADANPAGCKSHTNLLRAKTLAAVIKDLLYLLHQIFLLTFILRSICAAENVIVKCSAGNIQRFTKLMHAE